MQAAVSRVSRADLAHIRGWGRLGFEAVLEITAIVEAMHHNIASVPILAGTGDGRTRGITGLVYGTIRGITGLLGTGFDHALALAPDRAERTPSPEHEAVLAALNGVLGDHLAATDNPLAISMCVRRDGRRLPLERRELAARIPQATRRLAVFVHGLCTHDRCWSRREHDHGAGLARDLGYTSVYVHYNTGLHVSTNGRKLAEVLDLLVREWPVPVEELAVVAHSMGGLVARSACHYGATRPWLRSLTRLVFLGTPHHGAPLERCGNWLEACVGMTRYSAPLSRLGRIRSAGITDLRHGSIVDEDWDGRDRFACTRERPRTVPLPHKVACYAVAASKAPKPRPARDAILGDGLVPVDSALGRGPRRALAIPESRQWLGRGMGHFDLLHHPDVYDRLRRWFEA